MAAGCSALPGGRALLFTYAAALLSLGISPARGRVMLTGAGNSGRVLCSCWSACIATTLLAATKWRFVQAVAQPLSAPRPLPACVAERFQVGFRDLKPYIDEGYGHRFYYQVPQNPRGTVVFVHAVSGASRGKPMPSLHAFVARSQVSPRQPPPSSRQRCPAFLHGGAGGN